MLSRHEIKRKLGKEIFIYPFNEKQIKGVGCNLTVGDYAWSLVSKKPIPYDGKDRECGYIVEPGETVLVFTKETVAVSKRIGGTFHSKVDRVSEGFSSISTTLDPGWIGPLLISITNMGKEKRKLKLGESFVTLIFDQLEGASDLPDGNPPGRLDRLSQLGIEVGTQAIDFLNKDYNHNMNALKKIIKDDNTYMGMDLRKEQIQKIAKISLYWAPALVLLCFIIWQIDAGIKTKDMYALIAALAMCSVQGVVLTRK